MEGPKIIHVMTKKGKGYKFAEENPSDFHGTAPFEIKTGKVKISNIESGKVKTFSDVFGDKIVALAKKRKDIVAITAAMPDGTGLQNLPDNFPKDSMMLELQRSMR